MNSKIQRSYRKNLKLRGLIYFGGKEQNIIVKNLSITGLLAELQSDPGSPRTIGEIFNNLKCSTIVDLFLPEMNLTGDAEVIRVDMLKDSILIAMEFKNISFESDNFLYSRKEYRKRLQGSGKILLNGQYHEFNTVNVSIVGLMIQLNRRIEAKEGIITVFSFNSLELDGEIKIIWVEHLPNNETLMGLQYLDMENTIIKGIPHFSNKIL
jgi:hypothetical protein